MLYPGLIHEKFCGPKLPAAFCIAAIIVAGQSELELDYQFLPVFSEFFSVS